LWIEFLEFGCNFIGVIPVARAKSSLFGDRLSFAKSPHQNQKQPRTQQQASRGHETGEREIRFSLPQIKQLIELMQRAGMSSDDLPDDIE